MARPGRISSARRVRRSIRVFAFAVFHFGKSFLPPIAAVGGYMVLAALLLRWDLSRAGDAVTDFQTLLYTVYRQLFFEPIDALPGRTIPRTIVWLTPLVGVVLVAQGLVKVGATLFEASARRSLWERIMTDQMKNHVVVCGLGHVGYRVVEELLRVGEEVVGLEQNEDGSFVEIVRSYGVPVHVGDARRDELLQKCGVAHARAVVCATSNDLANLEIAIDSKRMNPSVRVVMRMFDQRLAGKVGGALELDESFSTSALAAPLIAIQATHGGVRSAYRVGEDVRVTAEIEVGAAVAGKTIAEVEDRAPCRIVARAKRKGDGAESVKGTLVLAKGDRVIVDVSVRELGAAQAAIQA